MPLDYASSGTDTFTANNFYISGNMNLNKVVYIYSTYSVRSVEHDDIEGTRFARKWQFQYLTAGPGYYIFPTFKIFAGLGKVLAAKNDGGEISYGRIFEKGVIYDIHINNYKIEIGYKFMSVPIDKNKIYSDDMPAKGDCQVFTIGVSSAFSLW
ncbi:MAG: hypothetical protein JSU85_08575 [Candidatus Zixiibacteriota bacterium]|nr:MAG: hypothetical protein JSU85_08575 [candidate division Zixibacteria bacterium]